MRAAIIGSSVRESIIANEVGEWKMVGDDDGLVLILAGEIGKILVEFLKQLFIIVSIGFNLWFLKA